MLDGNVDSPTDMKTIFEDSGFIRDAKTVFPNGFQLQHDNATAHVSRFTKNFLAAKKINVLAHWPPYSPDLNIIEVIWAIMKRRVQVLDPVGMCELKRIIQQEWDDLSIETIKKLVESMPRRMNYIVTHQRNSCETKI